MSEQRRGKGDRPRLPERPSGVPAHKRGLSPFPRTNCTPCSSDSRRRCAFGAGSSPVDELLRDDPAARSEYLAYLEVHAGLGLIGGRGASVPGITDSQFAISDWPSAIPPIIVDLSPAPHVPLFTLHSPVGSFLFSYTMAALLLAIALAGLDMEDFARLAGCGG